MILSIDIGNSRAKVGIHRNGELEKVLNYSHQEFREKFLHLPEMHNLWSEVKYIGFASVGEKDMKQALHSLSQALPQAHCLEIDYRTPLPIGNAYGSPKTLGIDRVCSAVAAFEMLENGPLLVIDAGTAITYDFVDAAGDYRGGGISPGIKTRFRALHDYTAALPLVDKEGSFDLVGENTENSIRSGVLNGVLAEIKGLVERYREIAGTGLQVFLTGGDAEFLGNHLKSVNFVDPNLLLKGIHSIILHNSQHA